MINKKHEHFYSENLGVYQTRLIMLVAHLILFAKVRF